jgi:hypothetical protein
MLTYGGGASRVHHWNLSIPLVRSIKWLRPNGELRARLNVMGACVLIRTNLRSIKVIPSPIFKDHMKWLRDGSLANQISQFIFTNSAQLLEGQFILVLPLTIDSF